MTIRRLFSAIVLTLAATLAAPVHADNLPTLTISSSAGTTVFDRDELEAMGLVSVKTHTPWTEGVVDFEGIPIADLLKKANAEGETATVIALNDYSVDIPTSDFTDYGTILALKRDGEYMPVADQGPYFVIYPFDSDPTLQGQPYYGRAVWQVKEITVQ